MSEQCWIVQVLKAGKGGQAALSLSGDEEKLQAAAQLVIGAAAIYDGSVTSLTASQVHLPCLFFAFVDYMLDLYICAVVMPNCGRTQPTVAQHLDPSLGSTDANTIESKYMAVAGVAFMTQSLMYLQLLKF